MRTVEITSETDANGGYVNSASRQIPTVKDDSEADERWFAIMAQALLAPKAGTALHLLTGVYERTCYRYAAGDSQPPAYFLRTLLRSEQGWIFLAAIMDGCNADWWRDLQDARDLLQPVIAKICQRLNVKEGQSDGRRKNHSR